MIPVVIAFAIIAVLAGSAALLLPLIKESRGGSRRRRRAKNRKKTHAPRQRLDITEPPPGADEGREAGS